MGMFEIFFDNLKRFGLEYFNLYYGIYKAQVFEVLGTDQGTLSLIVPGVGGPDEPIKCPAYPMFPFTGNGYGFYMLPEKDDFVWVQFEGGRVSNPVWTGGWYGTDELPSDFKGKLSSARGWKTPAGHTLVFDDADGKILITLAHSDAEGGESFIGITDEDEIVIQNRKGPTVFISGDSISLIDGSEGHEGNVIALDEEGAKITDFAGNMIFLDADGGSINIISQGDLVVAATGVVNIDGGNINILGNIEPGVLGNMLKLWLSTHTHVGNLGSPTGPPLTAATLATILSKIVKLG